MLFLFYISSIVLYLPVLPSPGDHVSRRSSPRPLRASLVSSSSTSSFRRALSSTRATLSVSPVAPSAEQAPHMVQPHNNQKSSAPDILPNQQLKNSPSLDPDGFSVVPVSQEDDPLDMQEVSKHSVFITGKRGHAHVPICSLSMCDSLKRCTCIFSTV